MGVWVMIHLALDITEMSRVGKEWPRNHWNMICIELFTVPLYKSYLLKKETQWVQQAWGGGQLVKHDAAYSTTTTCNQVWEDVTAESQAFQPERNELPL